VARRPTRPGVSRVPAQLANHLSVPGTCAREPARKGALTDTFTTGSTGYVHDGARWYDPATGNFTAQDINSYLGNPANGNRYAYAADNPANFVDPTGYDFNPVTVGYWAGVWTAVIYGCAPGAVVGFIGGAAEGPVAAVGGATVGCVINTADTAEISGAVAVLAGAGAETWNTVGAPIWHSIFG
jgi:RHS repeat-associated protein